VEEGMIEAHIVDGPFGDSIRVFVINKTDHGRMLLRLHDDQSLEWLELAEAAVNDPIAPTIELPGEVGRAVLDSLTRYYHGAEDTRALRRDYDAERKRNDTLVKALGDVALQLARRNA
jgi:hypothetical protein